MKSKTKIKIISRSSLYFIIHFGINRSKVYKGTCPTNFQTRRPRPKDPHSAFSMHLSSARPSPFWTTNSRRFGGNRHLVPWKRMHAVFFFRFEAFQSSWSLQVDETSRIPSSIKRNEILNKKGRGAFRFPFLFFFSSRKDRRTFRSFDHKRDLSRQLRWIPPGFSLSLSRNEYIFSAGENVLHETERDEREKKRRVVSFDSDARGARDVNPVGIKRKPGRNLANFVLRGCPATYVPVPLNGLSLRSALILKRPNPRALFRNRSRCNGNRDSIRFGIKVEFSESVSLWQYVRRVCFLFRLFARIRGLKC